VWGKAGQALIRFVAQLLIVFALVWAGGFALFVSKVPREGNEIASLQLENSDPAETGIVALTGGGLSRIRAAVSLMETGNGAKVLITGTHPDTKEEELAAYIENSAALFDCCIELGQRALTTRGNAIETRDWVDENGFERIIVVTTDYHMPRAIAEIRHTMPQTQVIAWPVASPIAPAKGWIESGEAWQVLVTEYNKFLLVRASQVLRLE